MCDLFTLKVKGNRKQGKVFLDNIAGAVYLESPFTILVCTQHFG